MDTEVYNRVLYHLKYALDTAFPHVCSRKPVVAVGVHIVTHAIQHICRLRPAAVPWCRGAMVSWCHCQLMNAL